MPAKDPTTNRNLWQQRLAQGVPSPTSSKKTVLEEEPDVDAPKQTRLSTNSSSKIKSEETPDVYASLNAIRSAAIESHVTKMRREDEQRATAAAEGRGSGYHHNSNVLPTSLSAWDVCDDEPQQVRTEGMPDWNTRLLNKQADKHLTNVELTLRILNEVKDRARKYGISFIDASPFPRWILGALYEMRLTVAGLDAYGEGMLSSLQRHTLSLAKLAVGELEEMKREVEKGSELGVDVWGTMKVSNGKARPSQTLHASEVEGEPHPTGASTSTQGPTAVSEEKSDAAQLKREGQQTRHKIKREQQAARQPDESEDEDECWKWTEEEKAAKVKQMLAALNKGEERKTVFIGEVDGWMVYHFFELAGQVMGVTRPRLEDDPVHIQQYTSRQMMDTLLSHELAIVRQTGRRMFPNGIMEVVDKDGNPIH